MGTGQCAGGGTVVLALAPEQKTSFKSKRVTRVAARLTRCPPFDRAPRAWAQVSGLRWRVQRKVHLEQRRLLPLVEARLRGRVRRQEQARLCRQVRRHITRRSVRLLQGQNKRQNLQRELQGQVRPPPTAHHTDRHTATAGTRHSLWATTGGKRGGVNSVPGAGAACRMATIAPARAATAW